MTNTLAYFVLELIAAIKGFTELRTIMEFKKPLENTLAYYDTQLIRVVKSFIGMIMVFKDNGQF